VMPEGDGIFIMGHGMIRQSRMSDLTRETMLDVPKERLNNAFGCADITA